MPENLINAMFNYKSDDNKMFGSDKANEDKESLHQELVAMTPFEEQISLAIANKITLSELRRVFLKTLLYVPDTAPYIEGTTVMEPLVINTPYGEMVAVFSSKYRLPPYENKIKWVTAFSGSDILQVLPKGKGIIVNPESTYCFQMGCDDIRELMTRS